MITENNILHQPTSVRRIPANVLIVMDTGGELRAVKSLDQTRKVARAVVECLRPGDSVAIDGTMPTSRRSSASGRPTKSRWTRRSAERIWPQVDRSSTRSKMATDFLLRSGLDNKHLVLISDGTDSARAAVGEI